MPTEIKTASRIADHIKARRAFFFQVMSLSPIASCSQFDPGKIAACIVDAIIIATHHRIIYGFVKLVKNLWGSPCVYNSMCDITGALYPLNISVGTDGISIKV